MYYVAAQLYRNLGLPLTEELVCQIHEITTRDIDYPNNTPGKYRSHAVSARTYIPPRTEEEIQRLMAEFIHWFKDGTPAGWDPIVRAIVAHFYVVSIHPFGDGNGRTARGVESFLLYQAQVNARGFYSLANYYYRRRSDYVQLLDRVRFETNGDLTPFVLFALQGLVEELEAVHSEILSEVRVIAFRDFAREVLSVHDKLATKSGDRMFHFLLGLGGGPISIRDLRLGKHELSYLYRNVTSRTLSRDINFLKTHDLITVSGDELAANLDVMTRFTPPMQLRAAPRRRVARRRR
jgi:Fic family protein